MYRRLENSGQSKHYRIDELFVEFYSHIDFSARVHAYREK